MGYYALLEETAMHKDSSYEFLIKLIKAEISRLNAINKELTAENEKIKKSNKLLNSYIGKQLKEIQNGSIN